jgi:hypothetical protein
MIDDDKFFAWLDGELGPTEAADVEAKVASDPELSRLAEEHRALKQQLRGAFDPIATAPMPERLQAALRPSAEIVDFAAKKRARSMPSLAQWAAMAATLVLGVLLGTMVPQRGTAPLEVQGGKLYAASALSRALDTQLASAPAGEVRIGLTFRDRSGEICRSFTAPASSGLACRNNGRWQVRGMFAAPEGQGSDYRMAAGMDPNLAALVDATTAGEAFDAAKEKAAKENGWR